MSTPFVKAAMYHVTTDSVEKSQADLLTILRRYGARDFGFDEDPNGREASVRFRITHGGRDLPVMMRVDINAVHEAMYTGKSIMAARGKNVALQRREQSKRTAWRLLIDWLDAACSTTAIGIQSVEEVFMAHIMVRDPASFEPVRLIEAFHGMQQRGTLPLALPPGARND